MVKITVSIPDDLKVNMKQSQVPINLSQVVTKALDAHLQEIEHGCYWGQEFGTTASKEDLEDIGEFPLPASRLTSPTDPADVVFAKRIWLGSTPTPEAKRHAEKFIKWLSKHDLRDRSRDASWMAAFGHGVQLIYRSRQPD